MNKQPDSVLELVRMYQAAGQRIAKAVENQGASTVKAYQKEVNRIIDEAVKILAKENHDFAYNQLPRAFNAGQGVALSKVEGEPEKQNTAKAKSVLAKAGFKYSSKAYGNNTYIELQSAAEGAGQGFKKRINKVIDELKKDGKDTLYNVKQAMVEDMRKNGVFTVKYKNGAQVPLEAYAAMAARTARAETQNIGSIGWAEEHGIDYVQMSTVFPTCPVCARFQGRVYCISGKDKRFMPLFGENSPLSRGYALVHPNCRHQFLPYNPKIHAKEMDDEGRKSKQVSSFKESDNNAKQYAKWQAGNRQRNDEMIEYEQMQRLFAANNINVPYTSLGGFRRAKRTNSSAYKDSRRIYNILSREKKYND